MIKFRAWDKVTSSYRKVLEIEFYPDGELKKVKVAGLQRKGTITPDNLVLEQFTGLKDINGKEIYEGDILEVTIDGAVQADKYLVKHVWDPHVWIEESDGYYAVSKMKVQGNVHENPELLEEDK
ncbi:YopX family protein [Lactiplantibacillus plantarum]|nr:YopX family protein [Lactiplantibacillus plantarum]MDO1604029.1 YopX family protein [Lactiplantibacillus plantarum]MEE4614699.1 YopX family protein [Lactiplantibacillus plantarum]